MADVGPSPAPPERGLVDRRALLGLIGGWIAVHSCMTGVRMAAPLAVLREGHAAWAVGILLGLFAAAPIVLALGAGRLADRHGYHLPIRVAVGLRWRRRLRRRRDLPRRHRVLPRALPCRDARRRRRELRADRDPAHRRPDVARAHRAQAHLQLARPRPALANVVGPVLAGVLIDLSGFALAFAVLALLPLASLAWAAGCRASGRPTPRGRRAATTPGTCCACRGSCASCS
jgi:MFS family permease